MHNVTVENKEAWFTQLIARLSEMERRTTFTIEPGRGATYSNGDLTLYAHGRYPRGSVLAGQHRRQWIDSFPSAELAREFVGLAKTKRIRIEMLEGSTYQAPNLSHLPDDTDY